MLKIKDFKLKNFRASGEAILGTLKYFAEGI